MASVRTVTTPDINNPTRRSLAWSEFGTVIRRLTTILTTPIAIANQQA